MSNQNSNNHAPTAEPNEATVRAAAALPALVIVFKAPGSSEFSAQHLNGVTRHQIIHAAHLLHEIMLDEELLAHRREKQRQESILGRLSKPKKRR